MKDRFDSDKGRTHYVGDDCPGGHRDVLSGGAQMDAPGGPRCWCGAPSRHESGWCGNPDCTLSSDEAEPL